jgi:hypothetical protein
MRLLYLPVHPVSSKGALLQQSMLPSRFDTTVMQPRRLHRSLMHVIPIEGIISQDNPSIQRALIPNV